MAMLLTLKQEEGGANLALAGRWNLARIADIDAALATARLPASPVTLDGARLETLDTAAALALVLRLRAAGTSIAGTTNLKPSHASVIETVRQQAGSLGAEPPRRGRGMVGSVGFAAVEFGRLVQAHMDFAGRSAAALAELVVHPRRTRWKELAAQLQHVCIEAIPVVALVSFLIGTVLAYLTMRLTEEIDALRTIALSPMQVLVLPRLLALVISLPLLVFVGDVAALGGAMAASGPLLDITPAVFIDRVHSQLALRHIVVGLGKAAVFGAAIALIGCRAGMTVERDARSIGISTTSTVVRCIVAVILLDAFFAVWLQGIGL